MPPSQHSLWPRSAGALVQSCDNSKLVRLNRADGTKSNRRVFVVRGRERGGHTTDER